jgi:hypothetical protein
MEVCRLKFIDSYNFLDCAQAKMPTSFRLSELKKECVPHLSIWNRTNITWKPIWLLNFTIQTTYRLLIAKLSALHTTKIATKPSISAKCFWITLYPVWIFYIVAVTN